MTLQDRIAERVRRGGRGALLLSELSPVVTLGKRAREEIELSLSREALGRLGIGVERAGRGGLATYHGPGQWVLFVVDSLERLTGDPRGVRRAVEGLLEAGRSAALPWDETLEIRSGPETGVWSGRGGKVISVGIQIEKGILLHGLAVNGFPTSRSFQGLRPCGLSGARVGYLLKDDGRAEFDRLGRRLLDAARERFAPALLRPALKKPDRRDDQSKARRDDYTLRSPD